MQVLLNHLGGGRRPHSNVRESPQHEHQSSWLARKHRDTSKTNQNDRLRHVQKTSTTILHTGDLIYDLLFDFKKAKTIIKKHMKDTRSSQPKTCCLNPRGAFKSKRF